MCSEREKGHLAVCLFLFPHLSRPTHLVVWILWRVRAVGM